MKPKFWPWIWTGCVLLAALAPMRASAQPVCDPAAPPWEEAVRMSELEPASFLIYPFYDARPGGAVTIHTVTNLNFNRVRWDNTFLTGDVLLHYFYVNGTTCLIFNRSEFLTPGDTLSVIAEQHNPEGDFGYLYVRAEDPETGWSVDFDYLVGDQLVVDPRGNFVWSVPAMGFRALTDERFSRVPAEPVRSGTGHAFVDLAVNDGDEDDLADFNGYEYAYFPDRLILSSFFENGRNVDTELILITPLDPLADVLVNFWFFNNDETRFSRSFRFSCYWGGPLEDISNIVRDLGGDAGEIPVRGLEAGWAVIDGRRATMGETVISEDPPILGFAVHLFRTPGGAQIGTARPLHHEGFQCGDDL